MEDLPGYDSEKSVVRLTTKLEIGSDGEDNPVGYLGRAHPLVRRALDRVRNLSFGGAAAQGQDPRPAPQKPTCPNRCCSIPSSAALPAGRARIGAGARGAGTQSRASRGV